MQMKTITRPTLQPSDLQKLVSWIIPSVNNPEFSYIPLENAKAPSLKTNRTANNRTLHSSEIVFYWKLNNIC